MRVTLGSIADAGMPSFSDGGASLDDRLIAAMSTQAADVERFKTGVLSGISNGKIDPTDPAQLSSLQASLGQFQIGMGYLSNMTRKLVGAVESVVKGS
jgi:hypothetical protein